MASGMCDFSLYLAFWMIRLRGLGPEAFLETCCAFALRCYAQALSGVASPSFFTALVTMQKACLFLVAT